MRSHCDMCCLTMHVLQSSTIRVLVKAGVRSHGWPAGIRSLRRTFGRMIPSRPAVRLHRLHPEDQPTCVAMASARTRTKAPIRVSYLHGLYPARWATSGPCMGFTAASLGSNHRIGPKRRRTDELRRPQLASSTSPVNPDGAENHKGRVFVGSKCSA